VNALEQPQRRQQKYPVGALQHALQERPVADAAFDQRDPRITKRGGDVGSRAANKVVDDHDFADAFGEELVDNVRADESGAANHHQSGVVDVHVVTAPARATPDASVDNNSVMRAAAVPSP
jgi:hypothetical protein